MPVYKYKGITDKGLVVSNTIEAESKQKVILQLKENGITPIEILQRGLTLNKKKLRRNMAQSKEIFKEVSVAQVSTQNSKSKTKSEISERMSRYFEVTKKITTRDIVIFTQDLYLLKKANFNNIHALSTIIQTTENPSFKGILEDILAGLESGEYMYTTMEYYSDVFPYIYTNMVKVGELSGSLMNSLDQAVRYLEESTELTKKIKKILIEKLVLY